MHDPINSRLQLALDEQVQAFLAKGGEITQIAIGTSGVSADTKPSQWSKAQTKKSEAKR